MRVLESLGLGLLLTAVVIGLLSLWLNSASGQALAQRLPRLSAVLHTRALMLLVMLSGIGLLVLSAFVTPSTAPPVAPPDSQPLPARQAPPAMLELPVKPLPEAVVPPAPLPTVSPPAPPPALEKDHDQPVPQARAVKPAPTLPPAVVPPKATAVPRASPDASEAVPQKKNIFSPRCTRLLEKVGAGEPMTPQEQHEMVSKCQ
jgi:hypothetical protein